MNRRAFFGMLAAGLAAAADPERALWVPKRKIYSIPINPRPLAPGEIVEYEVIHESGPFLVTPGMTAADDAWNCAKVIQGLMNHRYATEPAFRKEADQAIRDSMLGSLALQTITSDPRRKLMDLLRETQAIALDFRPI